MKIEISFELEREDSTFDVTVRADYSAPEKGYFDYNKGEGHPGCAADLEITSVTDKNGNVIVLSPEEKEQVEIKLWEEVENELSPESEDWEPLPMEYDCF